MRLIDADDYINGGRQSMHIFDDYPLVKYGLEVAILAMNKMPTTDAEPVGHGEWVYQDGYFHCTVCSYPSFQNKWNFCPMCGVKMDGGSE